ncbi:MAG: indole-3-glycerol phosphate synthase [Parvicellaceae bacterium]|jgi:indole-3-glycerol phosphate synthase
MNILDKIIDSKRSYVSHQKTVVPEALLKESFRYNAPTVSLKEYLLREDKSGIIAEFKRKSPSKGDINPYAKIEDITIGYMQSGASALSVLTDLDFFGGSDADLITARKLNFCPILRKDFVVDSYQIIEARSIGADAILLMASVLEKNEIEELSAQAISLGLEVLLEIHNENELDKLPSSDVIMGINARDLSTFTVNLQNCVDLFPLLPEASIKVAESGIHHPADVAMLREIGFNGFLIGERFMATSNPSKACRNFIEAIPNHKSQAQNA